jgi:uncharacterized membrane protein
MNETEEANETARLETFSDGVFAIAITLLVLEIHVPDAAEIAEHGGLAQALIDLYPSYLAYVTSFVTILIMWINHHLIFRAISRIDHFLFMFNGLLLLGITFVPFPTTVLAGHLDGDDSDVAAAFFAGTFALIALCFNLLWRYAAIGNRLLRRDINPAFVTAINFRYAFGIPIYSFAALIAFVSPEVSFGICVLLAILYFVPTRLQPVTLP